MITWIFRFQTAQCTQKGSRRKMSWDEHCILDRWSINCTCKSWDNVCPPRDGLWSGHTSWQQTKWLRKLLRIVPIYMELLHIAYQPDKVTKRDRKESHLPHHPHRHKDTNTKHGSGTPGAQPWELGRWVKESFMASQLSPHTNFTNFPPLKLLLENTLCKSGPTSQLSLKCMCELFW